MSRHRHSSRSSRRKRHSSASKKRKHGSRKKSIKSSGAKVIPPGATDLTDPIRSGPIHPYTGAADTVLSKSNIEVEDKNKFTRDLFKPVEIPNVQIADSVIDTFIPVGCLFEPVCHTSNFRPQLIEIRVHSGLLSILQCTILHCSIEPR